MMQDTNFPGNTTEKVADLITDIFFNGGKLFVAGNGGSMADALHISGELLKSFRIERKGCTIPQFELQPGVPVWVLGINPSLSSAVRNDFKTPDMELAQELFAAGTEGDALLGISTSGKAANIINAFKTAKEMGIKTIALTGNPGEPLSSLADISIHAEGSDTASIQENHIVIYHRICSAVEEKLFGDKGLFAGQYPEGYQKYPRFDFSQIKTYPIHKRSSRSGLKSMIKPGLVKLKPSENKNIQQLAEETAEAYGQNKPVIIMMGAHLIKNGLGPLLIDLIKRKIISIVAVNGACPVHDTEIALCGGTSEDVRKALPKGEFGFAEETGEIINTAYRQAYRLHMGAGETLGAIIAGDIKMDPQIDFPHKDFSVFYNAYKNHVPVTIHAAMGTDITDQHPNVSFEAKGYASGVDFSIFARTITTLTKGGIIIDIGGAVTQPEVLLKSVSMASNIGKAPDSIITAVFDLFNFNVKDMNNEEKPDYYRRNIKSITVRIPGAFNGRGIYIQGNQKETFAGYYSALINILK